MALVIASRPVGPTHCTVPDIRNRRVEDARRILQRAGLRLGRVESSREGAGQEPQPGAQVPCNSSVNLWVVAHTDVAVPDVRGRDLEGARVELSHAGLEVGGTSETRYIEAKPGTVVQQSPSPGTRVRRGSAVALVIASRPVRPTQCTVPDVRRLSEEAARSALRGAGLRLGRFERGGDERRQKPEPGARVPCGTTVDVIAVIL